MGNLVVNITDAKSGLPIPNGLIVGRIDTTPDPGWPNSCVSGSGWDFQATTNSRGQFVVPLGGLTCSLHFKLTIQANNYWNTASQEWQSGRITGDIVRNWTLSTLSTWPPPTGSDPSGGAGAQAGGGVLAFLGGIGDAIKGAGPWAALIIGLIVIGLILGLVFMVKLGGPSPIAAGK